MKVGVHSQLYYLQITYGNCYHQVTYAKFNFQTYYPPPYEREVYHYQKPSIENIRKAISESPWS